MTGYRSVIFLLLRTALLVATSCGAPAQTDIQTMKYLSQYGYLSPTVKHFNSRISISNESMKKAISEFQAFAGLNVTGQIDRVTKKTMALPRCGFKDKTDRKSKSQRYKLERSGWKKKELTYRISKYPRNLGGSSVDPEIERAFKVWSDVSGLRFTKKSNGQVDIEVRFENGEHGDGDPFDGPGGVLAHAYFPVFGGDAHFDDTETWTIGSYRGINLFQVAAHEFGHSLGLGHSNVRTALMAPFYQGYERNFRLDKDDILRIQALYGKSSTTPKPDSKDNELCNDASVDTIFNSADGVTYAFKGINYWKLTKFGIAPGYPRPISKSWPGLPGHIDAAFTYQNGKTYFFKGSQYWRFVGNKMDGNYPEEISEGFPGIPDNIDAALVSREKRRIYFFKGTKLWLFDQSQKPPVKSIYPRPISELRGIPDNLDAALLHTNGYTYFFKGGQYYRFNRRTSSVDVATPAFPRPVGYWWFGCKTQHNRLSVFHTLYNKL